MTGSVSTGTMAEGPEYISEDDLAAFLVETLTGILRVRLEHPDPAALAGDVVDEAMAAVRYRFAGNNCYIRKSAGPSLRDIEIYDRFNATNRDQLCAEYGITFQRLYQIVNAVRKHRLEGRLLARQQTFRSRN